MSAGLDQHCPFCPEPVDPNSRYVYRRITGWERKALDPSRKQGSDIVLREPLDEWAHARCISDAKQGLLGQQTMLESDRG